MAKTNEKTQTRSKRFPRIEPAPEQLAASLLRMPPRKRLERDYMKTRNGGDTGSDG